MKKEAELNGFAIFGLVLLDRGRRGLRRVDEVVAFSLKDFFQRMTEGFAKQRICIQNGFLRPFVRGIPDGKLLVLIEE